MRFATGNPYFLACVCVEWCSRSIMCYVITNNTHLRPMLVFKMHSHQFTISVIRFFRLSHGVQVVKKVCVHVFPDLYRLAHRQIPVIVAHIDRVQHQSVFPQWYWKTSCPRFNLAIVHVQGSLYYLYDEGEEGMRKV